MHSTKDRENRGTATGAKVSLEDYKAEVLRRINDNFAPFFKDVKRQHSSSDGWTSGCCVFHEDKNPSFSFNASTGAWKCHAGCGKGDVFDFVCRTRDLAGFKEALFAIGDEAGVARLAAKRR